MLIAAVAWLVTMLAPAHPPATVDACALLADQDVQRVLGVDVTQRQPGTQDARGLLLTQCYVGTGTPRSVSIAVAGPAQSGGRTLTPKQFWKSQFGTDAKEAAERKDTKAVNERETESGARAIAGVGDEAFWSGTRVAGALYVLRGSTFIRVSVGGIQSEPERIEKSKQLAAAALRRLPK
jgi:hypothetical protein